MEILPFLSVIWFLLHLPSASSSEINIEVRSLECKLLKRSPFIPPKCLECSLAHCTHSVNTYCWIMNACSRHYIQKKRNDENIDMQFSHFPIFSLLLPTLHSILHAALAAHIQPSCGHILFLFMAVPAAYGSSQARSRIRAAMRPMPQPQPQQHQIWATSATRGNIGSLTHWGNPGIKSISSQSLCLVLISLSHNGNLIVGTFNSQANQFM